MIQEILNFLREFEESPEGVKLIASITRKLYVAFKEEGFTHDTALALTIAAIGKKN